MSYGALSMENDSAVSAIEDCRRNLIVDMKHFPSGEGVFTWLVMCRVSGTKSRTLIAMGMMRKDNKRGIHGELISIKRDEAPGASRFAPWPARVIRKKAEPLGVV